jgi:hypothetical protein
LDVIHGQEKRLLCGEQLERGSHCDAESARIEWLPSLLHEEGDLEGMPSWRWQRWQDVVHDSVEEIAEAGEGEILLGLDRPAGQYAQTSFLRELESSEPESRLSDPGLAFQDECSRPVHGSRVEECPEPLELILAADHFTRHGA